MKSLNRIGLALLFFVQLSLSGFAQSIPAGERQALLDLYNSTNGPGWNNKSGWSGAAGTECSWYGVICDNGQTTVQRLELIGNNLVGTLPATLGNLPNLWDLYLNSNQLSGPIPTQLGNLTNLQHLYLNSNQLSGPIPAQLANLANLQWLYLSSNKLSGSIPKELANPTNLTTIDLSSNQLTGSIPPELGNHANLTYIDLSSNQLSGSIPPELGNLTNLWDLELSSNQLTGSIPKELANPTNLTYIGLSSNQLTGSIPPELGNLTKLWSLGLDSNQLTGSIPAELGNLAKLQGLDLFSNQLSGSIPPELGNLTNLWFLSLASNQLTGSIPAELGNLTDLQQLELEGNQLSGPIPAELGNLAKLQQLNLCHNSQLSGSIPAELGNLTNLQELNLGVNQLSGSIPEELGGLTNLQWLYLNFNQLSGPIPDWLGNLAKLQQLDLSSNQLTGRVPSSITNLTNLGRGGSDFRWNGLYSSDSAVVTFLNNAQVAFGGGDWQSTQTVPVTDLAAGSPTADSITLTWTPITYVVDAGGYEVFYATISGGPYTLSGTTAGKWATGWSVNGLAADTLYYFIVKSVTNPNVSNQNTVESDPSAEVSASTSIAEFAPPSIAKAFGAALIPLNASTSLSFTITNPNTLVGLMGIGFTDTLPAGLVISTPNGLTGSCGGGTITATARAGSVSLAGAALVGSASCTFSVNVTGMTAGTKNNTTGNVTSTNGGKGGTASASITVVAPPSIAKAFGAASIPLNASTSLSFTITNPNTSMGLTGIGFTDTLPAGLVISTPNGLTGSCGGGTIAATAGAGSVSLAGAALVGSASCTFSVNVTGMTAGTKNNTTGNVTSTNGGTGGTASASITVVAPPAIQKAFGAASIPLNASTSLTFTLTNPGANTVAETGVAFTDTLPAGLVVATPNGLTNTCTGTATATAGSGSISLTSGSITTPGTTCTVTVNVTGTTAGTKNNTTGNVTSTNGGTGGTASASITVVAPPAIQKAFGAASIPLNASTSLTFTLTNPGANTVAETGVAFTDTLPPGLVVATPNGLTNTCTGTATATVGSGSISLTSGSITTPGTTCTVTVNVTGTTAGTKPNTTGNVTSTNGGTGGTASASITVVAPPSIQKAFNPTTVVVGDTSTLTFTLTNPGTNTVAETGVAFTDTLPPGLVVATPNGLTNTCTGTATATVGSGSISLTSGSITMPGMTCTVTVNVTPTTGGQKDNTTGTVSSTNGGTGATSNTATLAAGGSSVSMNLTAGGSATCSTAGLNGTTQTGYATVAINAGAAPYGTAVFSFMQNGVTVSEAGVPVSPPTTAAWIFIDYRSSVAAIPGRISAGTVDIDTGIAVVNYGSASANLTYTLRNIAGTTPYPVLPFAMGHGTLAAGAHFAKFIDELNEVAPDFVLPANFQTAIQFASLEISSDQPVSILALRMTTNQRNEALFTTTPTADLTQTPTNGVIFFPQFADGGGYTTSLVLLNTSTGTETGTLQLRNSNGNPMVVNQVGGTSGSVFRYSIPSGGAVRFQTDGSPATTATGWAQLTPDAGTSTPVGAGVFGYNPGAFLETESGIPATVSTTHARIYVDLSGGHDTGLAIANPTSTNASITITAFQSDGVTGVGTSQGPLQLPANGYSAFFADGFIAGLPAGFTGVLDIVSSTPFAALTVRSLTNERGDFLLATFPIADMTVAAPSPIVFPQIADGGGYVTQFILVGTGGASSVTLNYYGEDGKPLAVGK